MFAHCLLPALLLIAAVDYSTGQKLPLVVTKAFEGNSSVPLTHHETFQIPKGQCYGVLDVNKQPALQCMRLGVTIVSVWVEVYDVDHVNIIFKDGRDFGKVIIKRKPNKCNAKAIVVVRTGCGPLLPPQTPPPHIIW